MRRIAVVTATRAEFGLLRWLLEALSQADDVELQLVVTGAHLSPVHGNTVREIHDSGLPIAESFPILLQGDSALAITKSLGLAVLGFADVFARLRPDLLVLLGDRYEILAAAQAAMIARVPIAHIHGGESTEGVLDEAVRHAVTKMSHLHFVAADTFRRRVIRMGESPERVWVTGALGLDGIQHLALLSRQELEASIGISLRPPTFLVTYHPETLTNTDPGEDFQTVLDVLAEFDGTILLTGVNADPSGASIRERAGNFASQRPGRVIAVESLGSLRYLSAISHADVVVGNSSSGIIEAPAIGTPTVDIGDRQRGRPRAPSVLHCLPNRTAVRLAIDEALSPRHRELSRRRETPYGSVGASERIAEIVRSHPLSNLLVKRFHEEPTVASD